MRSGVFMHHNDRWRDASWVRSPDFSDVFQRVLLENGVVLGLFAAVMVTRYVWPEAWWRLVLAAILLGIPIFLGSVVVAYWLGDALTSNMFDWPKPTMPLSWRWHPWRTAGLFLVAAGGVAIVLLIWATPLLKGAAYVLPSGCVWVCGNWFALVMHRWRWRRDGWVQALRWLADAVVVAAVGAALLGFVWGNLITTASATALVFPVGIAMVVWVWRVMTSSDLLAVRAGADVVGAVLLGALVVLFAVWLGNVTAMTGPAFASMRGTLALIGAVANPPWWVWTAAFALLAAANIAVFRLSRRPGPHGGRHRARVAAVAGGAVPVGTAVRRVADTVHISLLLVVLIGVATPSAVGTIARDALTARYIVAYQRDIAAQAETVAYQQISLEITAAGPAERAVIRTEMNDMYQYVSQISSDDTGAQAAYAYRTGVDRATDLLAAQRKLPAQSESPDTARLDSDSLAGCVNDTRTEESTADGHAVQSRQAGRAAASVISNVISIYPGNAPTAIVQAYLSGLVEEGPLKDLFAAKIEGDQDPGVEEMFSPDEDEMGRAVSEEDALGPGGVRSGGGGDDEDLYPLISQQDDEMLEEDDESGE
jgi:hypothetical protein